VVEPAAQAPSPWLGAREVGPGGGSVCSSGSGPGTGPLLRGSTNGAVGASAGGSTGVCVPRIHRQDPERADHPTQKPLQIVERMVLSSCPPGGLVLDPFTGSGTTAVACARHGRRFVGFEINPDYVDVARARVASVMPLARADAAAAADAAEAAAEAASQAAAAASVAAIAASAPSGPPTPSTPAAANDAGPADALPHLAS